MYGIYLCIQQAAYNIYFKTIPETIFNDPTVTRRTPIRRYRSRLRFRHASLALVTVDEVRPNRLLKTFRLANLATGGSKTMDFVAAVHPSDPKPSRVLLASQSTSRAVRLNVKNRVQRHSGDLTAGRRRVPSKCCL